MSADNSIVVLRTDGKNGNHEYRVEEMSASENLFWHEDEEDHSPNWPFINLVFGKSQIFEDRELALSRAQELERECVFVEYGITIEAIDDSFHHLSEAEARRLVDAEHASALQRAREQQTLMEKRRRDAQIELGPEEGFEATSICGYLVRSDGSRVHGSIVLHELEKPCLIDPTKLGLKLKFQPSDW